MILPVILRELKIPMRATSPIGDGLASCVLITQIKSARGRYFGLG